MFIHKLDQIRKSIIYLLVKKKNENLGSQLNFKKN